MGWQVHQFASLQGGLSRRVVHVFTPPRIRYPDCIKKAHKKLAGEAAVLAPDMGVHLGTDEIGGKRPSRF